MTPERWQQIGHAGSLIGRQVGVYDVVSLLGAGGMGEKLCSG